MSISIQEVKAFINMNMRDVHTQEDIAKRFNYSVETLRKDFRRKEGRALHEFILRARIEMAKKLLIQTDFPCKEICFKVGFKREDSGARSFKENTGVPMKEFRMKYRNGEKLQRFNKKKWSV